MFIRCMYSFILGGVIIASGSSHLAAQAEDKRSDRKKIEVIADDGAFTPSVIRGGAHNNLVLSIHAKDKDYPFVVPDVGVTTTVKRGTSVDIEVGSLGVGKHLFSCGSECGGYIELDLLSDEE